MIIYCNGDSFTSGVDLADYLIPGYPGGTPTSPWALGQVPSVVELVREWHKNTYDNSHQLGKSRQTKMGAIRYEEFNRAWPNKLHKLSGYPVTNNAQSGSSMDRIARTTVSDLISLKEEHANIISIIGLTGIDRSELPTSGRTSGRPWTGSSFSSWVDIIHHRPNLNPDFAPIFDFKLKYETDYHCYTNFYKNVILIKNFCSVNNIRLYFVLPLPLPPKFWQSDYKPHPLDVDAKFSYIDIKNLKNLENYANLVPAINMTDIATSCKLPEVYAPGGHFVESIHEIVADKLFNIIKQ